MDQNFHTEPARVERRPSSAPAEPSPALGILAQSLAEELITPLAAVVSNAQALVAFSSPSDLSQTGPTGLAASAIEDVKTILREATIASGLIADFLSVAGPRDSSPHPVSLAQTVDHIIRVARYYFQTRGIELSVPDLSHIASHQDNTMVMADQGSIEGVFLELIIGAGREASSSEGRPKTVSIEFLPGDGTTLRIAIKHSRAGRKKLSADTDFLCHSKVIETQGGKLDQTSTAEGIEQMVVSFPLIEREHTDTVHHSGGISDRPALVKSEGTGPQQQNHTKVLLVDDEEGVRTSICKFLRRSGLEVETAFDGKDALRMLEASEYHVVVSDLRMPGFSGEELYMAISRDYPDLARRVIFSSGDLSGEETGKFLEASGCPALEKPYELANLLMEIERIQTHSTRRDLS